MDKWRSSSFIDADEDPMGPMANLIDIILVFACGLVAALVSVSPDLQTHFKQAQTQQTIQLSKELPQVPEQLKHALGTGEGYEALGQVYRDPKTGKLILIGE